MWNCAYLLSLWGLKTAEDWQAVKRKKSKFTPCVILRTPASQWAACGRLYGKFGFSIRLQQWCPYERCITYIPGAGSGCGCNSQSYHATFPCACPLRATQAQCHSVWQGARAAETCRTKEPLGATPYSWWKEKSLVLFQQVYRPFQTGAETLSIALQCHMLGLHFLLFSSLGPGSAKVQPAAAPLFDYWWGLGFIFYIELCRCARHFTQIYKDRALKSSYSPNMSQHS